MLRNVLNEHVGYMVAINATLPRDLDSCGLKSVSDDHFSIVTQDGLLIHIPFHRILSIVENNEGGAVTVGGFLNRTSVRVVIQIEHMMIYSNGHNLGCTLPV